VDAEVDSRACLVDDTSVLHGCDNDPANYDATLERPIPWFWDSPGARPISSMY